MIRAALACLLLSLGTAHARRVHVVAIGNDLGRSDEMPLRYAERDARGVADVLRRLGGAQSQDVVTVQGGTAGDVRGALLEVNTRLRAQSDQSVLIVYYSGHADAGGLHLGDTTLPYAELKNIVAGSSAKVRVLILDGCRSGGATRVKGVQSASAFAVRLDTQTGIEGLAVMTSSAAGEDAHESETLRGSFFTHHLLAALVGAGDRDRDGRVTLTEAYAYAFTHTLRASERTPTLQHPTYAYDIKGKGDLVLTRLDVGVGMGWLRAARAATYLLREGDDAGPVHTVATIEQSDVRMALPAGSYFVQERHRDHYREYAVDISAGAEVRLAQQPYRTVAYARMVRKGAGGTGQGIYALGTAHGAVLQGAQIAPGVAIGYALDLPWATFSLRGRFEYAPQARAQGDSTLTTWGAGVTAERVVDFNWGSVGVGVLVEGLRVGQALSLSAGDETRVSWGAAFGGLLALETGLGDRLFLRLEGGPITRIFSRALTRNGAQTSTATTSRFTAWSGLGLGVRF
ncbi:MAG: hypothetical protein ACI9U2_001230 [Bradymonadia bacterium]|jgi:hypothetical protein